MNMISNVKNNHVAFFISSLEEMLNDKFMCDFIIKVDEDEFPVHRVVLAGTSKYFKAMFSSEMKEVKQGFVQMLGTGSRSMKISIDFMYTGTAGIDSDNVEETLSVASLMQLDGLADLCFHFLEASINVSSCLQTVRLASFYNRGALLKFGEEFIVQHLEEVIDEPMFPKISKDELLRYITSLWYKREISWKAAVRWMGDEDSAKKTHFSEILSAIRISTFSFSTIFNTILQDSILEEIPDARTFILEEWTCDMKSKLTLDNYYKVKLLIERHDLSRSAVLLKQLRMYFAKNFDFLFEKEDFLHLNGDEILSIFSDTKHQYFSEETKWRAIVRWVRHDENRREAFSPLFDSIDLNLVARNFIRSEIIIDSMVNESIHCAGMLLKHLCSDSQPAQHIACLDRSSGEISIIDPSEKNYSVITKVSGGIGIVSVGKYLYVAVNTGLFRLNNNGSWTELPSPPCNVNVDSQVIGGLDKIYIVNNNGSSIFHPSNNQWTQNYSGARKGACLVAYDDSLYALGGFRKIFRGQQEMCKEASIISPISHSVKPMNHERAHASGTFHRGMIWIMGGSTNTVEIYHPMANMWTEMNRMVFSRGKFACCVVRDKIYVLGGTLQQTFGFGSSGMDSGTKDEAIEVYDDNSQKWYTTQTLKRFLGAPSCCSYSPPPEISRIHPPVVETS